MPRLRIIPALILVLSAAACAQRSDAYLSGSELNQVVRGNEFRYSGWVEGKPVSGEMTFNENGNLYVDTQSGDPEGGTWFIKGDRLCTRLVALRDGKETCYAVTPVAENRYETSHGFWLEGPLKKTN